MTVRSPISTFGPMTENDFAEDDVFEFYKSIFEMEKLQYFNTEAAVIKSSQIVDKKLPEDEDEYLKKMAFIYLLGYDEINRITYN